MSVVPDTHITRVVPDTHITTLAAGLNRQALEVNTPSKSIYCAIWSTKDRFRLSLPMLPLAPLPPSLLLSPHPPSPQSVLLSRGRVKHNTARQVDSLGCNVRQAATSLIFTDLFYGLFLLGIFCCLNFPKGNLSRCSTRQASCGSVVYLA